MGGTSCKTDIKDKDFQKIHKVTRVLSDQYYNINTFCLYLITILCTNTALALGSFSTPTSTSESWAVTVGRKSWKDSFSTNRKVGNDGNKVDCLGLTLLMASHDSITNFINIFATFCLLFLLESCRSFLRIIQVTENFTGIHYLLDPTASAEVTRTSKPIDGIGFQP